MFWFAQTPPPSVSSIGIGLAILMLIFILFSSIKILIEYERAVVFRLGRFTGIRGPGLIILIPFLERMERIDTRTFTYDVPPQDIITRDNVSVKVNAVIYFRVVNPKDAIIKVENYQYATSQMAQTKLRDALGRVELDDLLSNRDKINDELQQILDVQTDPWGIKVSTVELKHVDLPPEMVRAMAKQAEAERERRAKVINAEGEYQASTKLGEAAGVLEKHPMSLQLRYLQSLVEIAGANTSSTTIFPIPLDLITPLLGLKQSFSSTQNPSLNPSATEKKDVVPSEESGTSATTTPSSSSQES